LLPGESGKLDLRIFNGQKVVIAFQRHLVQLQGNCLPFCRQQRQLTATSIAVLVKLDDSAAPRP
jgi:hypothetical protein